MRRGWVVIYNDGTVLNEEMCNWRAVDKSKIKILRLRWEDKVWEIKDKKAYIQFKSASHGMGESSATLESRVIGYEDEAGNEVLLRVNEKTGFMRFEVREKK